MEKSPIPFLTSIPARPLPHHHPDLPIITAICREVEARAGGWRRFEENVPILLRRALDEVIDTPRTSRFFLDQTEKTEKTYIGTKVEIVLRDFLELKKGILDLVINEVDVDIKNTVTNGWMIPVEAIGKPCILVYENEDKAMCGVGVIVAHPTNLTTGLNRDRKAAISATGRRNIHWLLQECPYPRNIWLDVPVESRLWIMSESSGNRRLYRLLHYFIGRPVSRYSLESVGQQQDFMKRIRANGGVRDLFGPEGIVVLSGTYDRQLAFRIFGINIAKDEIVACRVEHQEQLEAVRESGHQTVTGLWRGVTATFS
ncbi:NaeI family type II restriction endonuclease [Roseomonas mucosa]|uniref:NaeI family type II restriction endonuclease n=1 Tax=Roseomonas mucosa TaxID=207340 RepID=UPI00333E91A8